MQEASVDEQCPFGETRGKLQLLVLALINCLYRLRLSLKLSTVIPLEPVPSESMASPMSHGSISLGILNMAMTSLTGAFLWSLKTLQPIEGLTLFLQVLIEIDCFSQKFHSRFIGGRKANVRTWTMSTLTPRHCPGYVTPLLNLCDLLLSFLFSSLLYHPPPHHKGFNLTFSNSCSTFS